MLKQGYHKGEKVFLNGSKDDVGSGIRGVKRDTEIVVLLGFLILLLLIVTGRHGALTVGTVHNKSNYIFRGILEMWRQFECVIAL